MTKDKINQIVSEEADRFGIYPMATEFVKNVAGRLLCPAQEPEPQTRPDLCIRVDLSPYHIVNLRELLEAAAKFSGFHTGDWLLELGYLLPKFDMRPNMTADEMTRRTLEELRGKVYEEHLEEKRIYGEQCRAAAIEEVARSFESQANDMRARDSTAASDHLRTIADRVRSMLKKVATPPAPPVQPVAAPAKDRAEDLAETFIGFLDEAVSEMQGRIADALRAYADEMIENAARILGSEPVSGMQDEEDKCKRVKRILALKSSAPKP